MYVFECLLFISICYLFGFKYFNHLTLFYFFKKKKNYSYLSQTIQLSQQLNSFNYKKQKNYKSLPVHFSFIFLFLILKKKKNTHSYSNSYNYHNSI